MRFIFFIASLVACVQGAIIPVVSPYAPSDVATAIAAASAGDTVQFPAGVSATWSSTVTVNKNITIDGNGATLTSGAVLNNGLFNVTGVSSSTLVRITGFTFNLVDFSASTAGIVVSAVGSGSATLPNLRIDHNTFRFGYAQIVVSGAWGVIDNNTFRNSRKAIDFSGGTNAQANASWNSMAAGTSEALFIETNTFVDDASYPAAYTQEKIGTENGGKLVIRYNTFNFDAISIPGESQVPIITHGNAAGGVPANQGYWEQGFGARRGQSVVEVYNNTASGPRITTFAYFRGSANLVFNNVIDSVAALSDTPNITVYEEEQYDTSNWSPSRTAWPAEDQVHNTFVWSNTFRRNGVTNTNYFIVNPNSTDYIQQDRDYFLHAPQATGGSESFTGQNGGSSSYPTNGSTYPTLGNMTFSASGPNAYYGYVPYTYPHPLVNSLDSGRPGTQGVLVAND